MKLPQDQFSPRVNFLSFKKNLKELDQDFEFILSANHHNVKIYDELVVSRHKYAHANKYAFDESRFEPAIQVVDYLRWECTFICGGEYSVKKTMVKDFKMIKGVIKELLKLDVTEIEKNQSAKDKAKLIRKKAKSFQDLYELRFDGLEIFNNFFVYLNGICTTNFSDSSGYRSFYEECRLLRREYF
ncbi:hypothetical protein PT226_04930 [Erysipelothrix rhusiopathiae]|nr:hypothetical protein [Erysipelothrix rhusiopathiae]MDE8339758.1 hypothetical protein [Erysipelothrix rhusiopathiae]